MADVSPRCDGELLDVLVVGAGQAGLVMGWHLARRGLRFRIVDAGAEVGHTWRRRWDSLRLFTAAQYDGLPGMPFPAPHDTYPGKDDVAAFLQAYAAKFDLPVALNTKVTRLQRTTLFEIDTEQGPMRAHNVVVATGPFQNPFVPKLANGLDAAVRQLHSSEYRRPADVPRGRVLVVGAANTGCQIALELAATHAVEISVGQQLPTIRQRPLGRDVWWWATLLGVHRIPRTSWLGRRMARRDVIIGGGLPELRRRGVVVRPRACTANGRAVAFADGTSGEYDAILWATGFRTDHSWIQVPGVADAEGNLEHHRGVTRAPGLYVLGLSWQHTRTSALLGWVTRDAEYLADHITGTSAR